MYTLEDVYKTFPSGCTEDYKILRAFEMGKQATEKRIAELEKENERLKDELKALRESIKDYGAGCYENGLRNGKRKLEEQLTKAKEIILRLYNAGRDVLMCRAEEKAYDNLSNAINDKSIEQFLSEVENV